MSRGLLEAWKSDSCGNPTPFCCEHREVGWFLMLKEATLDVNRWDTRGLICWPPGFRDEAGGGGFPLLQENTDRQPLEGVRDASQVHWSKGCAPSWDWSVRSPCLG